MSNFTFSRPLLAYVLPFAVFMLGLASVGLVEMLGNDDSPLWLREPKYWIYPLQTLLCAAVLVFYWKDYEWGPLRPIGIGIAFGVLVFLLWVAPQMFLGAPPRRTGFDPYDIGDSDVLFWLSLMARFARLVIIVPLLEEIFWRGFLMRYLIKENFTSVPFGTPNLASFSAVVFLFAFVHDFEDFFGALAAGVIYNSLAIWTRSLAACVVAHLVTNLLLGLYIMQTRQWGFW